jgi:hypothetical protein
MVDSCLYFDLEGKPAKQGWETEDSVGSATERKSDDGKRGSGSTEVARSATTAHHGPRRARGHVRWRSCDAVRCPEARRWSKLV